MISATSRLRLRRWYPPTQDRFSGAAGLGNEYFPDEIHRWLEVFYRRFFSQQFKRSAQPDGPKVRTVAPSPRGRLANAERWKAEVIGGASLVVRKISTVHMEEPLSDAENIFSQQDTTIPRVNKNRLRSFPNKFHHKWLVDIVGRGLFIHDARSLQYHLDRFGKIETRLAPTFIRFHNPRGTASDLRLCQLTRQGSVRSIRKYKYIIWQKFILHQCFKIGSGSRRLRRYHGDIS